MTSAPGGSTSARLQQCPPHAQPWRMVSSRQPGLWIVFWHARQAAHWPSFKAVPSFEDKLRTLAYLDPSASGLSNCYGSRI